jgi:hypothetical protein
MSMPVTTGGAPGGPKCHRKRSDIVVYFKLGPQHEKQTPEPL